MRPNAVDPEATRGPKFDGKDGKKDENDTEEFDGFSAAMAQKNLCTKDALDE